ncbi:MAG: hypothetical protein ABFR75_08460 [Acidobacteriota bacterium]
MALLVLLNNFMHDFSAAGWIFCSILLWFILKKITQEQLSLHSEKSGKTLIELLKIIRLFMLICAAGIVVFGIVRTIAYKEYEWSAAAGENQVTLLIIKHIILTAVFIFGVIYYRKAGERIRKEVK